MNRNILILMVTLMGASCGPVISEVVVNDLASPCFNGDSQGTRCHALLQHAAMSQSPTEFGEHLVHLGIGKDHSNPLWLQWGLRLQPAPQWPQDVPPYKGTVPEQLQSEEGKMIWLGPLTSFTQDSRVLPLPPESQYLPQEEFAAMLSLALNQSVGMATPEGTALYYGAAPIVSTLYGALLPGAPSIEDLEVLLQVEETLAQGTPWLASRALRMQPGENASSAWQEFMQGLGQTLILLDQGRALEPWAMDPHVKSPWADLKPILRSDHGIHGEHLRGWLDTLTHPKLKWARRYTSERLLHEARDSWEFQRLTPICEVFSRGLRHEMTKDREAGWSTRTLNRLVRALNFGGPCQSSSTLTSLVEDTLLMAYERNPLSGTELLAGLTMNWMNTPRPPQSYTAVTTVLSEGIGSASAQHANETFGIIGKGIQMLMKSSQEGPNSIYVALRWTEKALRAPVTKEADPMASFRPFMRGMIYGLMGTLQVKEGKVYNAHQTLDKIPELIPDAAGGLAETLGGEPFIHEKGLHSLLHFLRHSLDREEPLHPSVEKTMKELCQDPIEPGTETRGWCALLMASGLATGHQKTSILENDEKPSLISRENGPFPGVLLQERWNGGNLPFEMENAPIFLALAKVLEEPLERGLANTLPPELSKESTQTFLEGRLQAMDPKDPFRQVSVKLLSRKDSSLENKTRELSPFEQALNTGITLYSPPSRPPEESLSETRSISKLDPNDWHIQCDWTRPGNPPVGGGVRFETTAVEWLSNEKHKPAVQWFNPEVTPAGRGEWSCRGEAVHHMKWDWESNLTSGITHLESAREFHGVLIRSVELGALLLPDSSAVSHPGLRNAILRGRREIPARDFAWLSLLARSRGHLHTGQELEEIFVSLHRLQQGMGLHMPGLGEQPGWMLGDQRHFASIVQSWYGAPGFTEPESLEQHIKSWKKKRMGDFLRSVKKATQGELETANQILRPYKREKKASLMSVWRAVAGLAADPKNLDGAKAGKVLSNPILKDFPGEIAGTALLFANMLSQQGKQEESIPVLQQAYEQLAQGPLTLHQVSLFRVLLSSNAIVLEPEKMAEALRGAVRVSQGRLGLRDMVQLRLMLIKSLLVTGQEDQLLPELLPILRQTSTQASIPPFLWTLRALSLALLITREEAASEDMVALSELIPSPESMKPTHEWIDKFVNASSPKGEKELVKEFTGTLFGLP